MLMGAAIGKSQIGLTTDANFVTRAKDFFNAYGSTLQTIGAELLPTGASALAGHAQTDVNARAALAALSVVSVEVSSVVAENFGLYNEQTGQGHITASWIKHRAEFTAHHYTKLKNKGGNVQGTQNLRYFDKATGIEVLVGWGADNNQRTHYLFGGEAGDALTGFAHSDVLYGGGGDDTLTGQGGNDHIEGNIGNDQLDGGAGRDTLLGGTGNDVLTGGDGNDELAGGLGLDVYAFAGDWGSDVVIDADGSGSITVGGTPLTGSGVKKVGERSWATDDGSIVYIVVPTSGGKTDLVITVDQLKTITIRDWQQGTRILGITLPAAPVDRPTSSIIDGDFIKRISGGHYATEWTSDQYGKLYVSDGPQANAQDMLNGTADANLMRGLGGNDAISGMGGNDVIEGGDGDDMLLGGEGRDLLIGGAGNDYISGSGLSALTLPTAVGFTAPTAQGTEISRGFNWVLSKTTDAQGSVAHHISGGADPRNYWLSGSKWLFEDTPNFIDAGAGDDIVDAGMQHDTVLGGDGKDIIFGLSGSDALFGDAGDDLIFGDGSEDPNNIRYTFADKHGEDLLVGGDGNDSLIGEGGDDDLRGDAGNDKLWGDLGNGYGTSVVENGSDRLDGGAGDDELVGGGKDDILEGGSGRDTLWGDDSEANLPTAKHGKDWLDGGDGDDELQGGGGADELWGGTGDDLMWGDAAQAKLSGAAHGNDFIDGEDGNDTIAGAGGKDTLYGGRGDDAIWGDAETGLLDESFHDDDIIYGGDGKDSLFGGSGDDVLDGGAGDDYISGGNGNNVYVFGPGSGRDFVDSFVNTNMSNDVFFNLQLTGGVVAADLRFVRAASDLVILLAGSNDVLRIGSFFYDLEKAMRGDPFCAPTYLGLRIIDGPELTPEQLAARTSITTQSDDLLVAFGPTDPLYAPGVNVAAGDGNDSVYGRDGADLLNGGTGDDTIYAGGGADTVFGDAGDDAIYGEAGADYLDGGEGSDGLSGGDGDDTLVGGSGLRYGRPEGDGLNGGDGNDVYVFERGFGRDSIGEFGTVGSSFDTVQMGQGILPSHVTLTRGPDYSLLINLNGSDDVVKVHQQFYPTYPGETTDKRIELIKFADGSSWDIAAIEAKVLLPTAGNDTLVGYGTSDSIEGGDGHDHLSGEHFPDALLFGADTIAGGRGNDYLNGGRGADELAGGAGDDALYGAADNDVLDGGSGDDWLYGDGGDDLLDGGAGNDMLEGGNGVDTYVFGVGSGRDEVNDHNYYHGPSYDAAGTNLGIVLLGVGLLPADMTFTRVFDSLVLSVNATHDQLTIVNFFWSGSPEASTRIQFANGTVWDLAEVQANLSPVTPPVGMTVSGSSAAESLLGGAGDDSLNGGGGNDTLDGGLGDDLLDGGVGSDRYLFGRGSGQDTIDSADTVIANQDEIRLGSGIAPSDLILEETDYALVLSIRGTADSIRVRSHYYPQSGFQISRIVFADGLVWDKAAIAAYTLDASEGLILSGGASGDSLTGSDSGDRILGAAGNDTLGGGIGDDRLFGGDDNDELYGGGQDDSLFGGAGADVLLGEAGDDQIKGEAGDDTLDGGLGSDTLDGGPGNDTYRFNIGSGQDVISSVDLTVGKVDVLRLGPGITAANLSVNLLRHVTEGDLLLSIPGTSDSIRVDGYFVNDATAGSQIEQIVFDDGTVWGIAEVKALAIIPTAQSDLIQGYSTADVLDGLSGNDELYGLGGNDSIDGGHGEDTVYGGADADLIVGGSQNDSLQGNAGSDVLHGDDGDDTLYGGEGNDLLLGGAGNDVLIGGDNYLHVLGIDTLDGGAGDDLYGDSNGDDIYLFGKTDGKDRIGASYSRGWNILRFKAGVSPSEIQVKRILDPLLSYGSSWLELAILGTEDRIRTADFFNPDGSPSTESLAFHQVEFADGTIWDAFTVAAMATLVSVTGTTANDSLVGSGAGDYITGLNGADTLVGADGDDWLDGGTGTDSMLGGIGNDTFVVDSASDLTIELADQGLDTVASSINWVMGTNIENLRLVGTGPVDGTGNELDNVLTGNSANNVLDGATGSDSLFGGLGDDTYVVDSLSDLVSEVADNGLDTVNASLSWSLGAELENLTLTGTASIDATGNALANVLRGNAGNNVLTGAAGADTLIGGAGNDIYRIDSASDVVIEAAGEGVDTVESSLTMTLGVNVENLKLTGTGAINGTGNALANALVGNGGANRIDGSAGVDTMTGATGNDTYIVDDSADVIVELSGGGADSVEAWASYALSAEVEKITLMGANAINATGNALANTLVGNSAANRLDGGAGNDSMSGGAGNDIYVVDSSGDTVTEGANAGIDTVESSLALTLANNLENLVLTGTGAIAGTGNTLNNLLTGNGSSNTLNGAAGADTMAGAGGNDTYVVDNAGDVVNENAGEGSDLVQSSVTYTLAANVENLTQTGTNAINATGNTLANVLTGNAGANRLDGGEGADSLIGGGGNDVYVVDSLGDVITEAANAGTDTVETGISLTLGANLENLTLTGTATINGTGNGFANVLRGNTGDNLLDGAAGNDSMLGGAGNDSYIVDATTDVITENANEGTDTIQSGVNWTLGANLENLVFTGTSARTGSGNTLNNVITGGSGADTLSGLAGNDTLNGGAGNDSMLGGAGNDVYIVNATGDVLTEAANEGTDTVRSEVAWTLAVNFENLELLGTAVANATGNAVNNSLVGNSATNSLSGLAGNDTLDGGLGNDTLNGGVGADIYVFGRGYGADRIIDADATAGVKDAVNLGAGVVQADLQFTKSGNDLIAAIRGTADALTIQDWYLGTQNRVEEFRFSDGSVLTDIQAQSLVGAMAAFSPAGASAQSVPFEESSRQSQIAVSAFG